ncbi:MAG: radical SAM protein [Methanobacteriaceae archaeon]|nr:radical SAM protein [Methanobacteriaceae archaeon]
MIIVKEVESKSILSKTAIPKADYVINPYIGCSHGCIYCYARFMKRFTGHKEPWGSFLDIKINSPQLVPKKTNKYHDKYILISSVTDPYLQFEREYQITRKILENLLPLDLNLMILTKSHLVLRDLDIIKKFQKKEVGISISTLDEDLRKKLEPSAPSIQSRLNTLNRIHKQGVRNYLFISPIFPYLTDWKQIIDLTRDYVDYYMFENLNVIGSVWPSVKKFLDENHPGLTEEYHQIYFKDNIYWEMVKYEIINFCENENLEFEIYFH